MIVLFPNCDILHIFLVSAILSIISVSIFSHSSYSGLQDLAIGKPPCMHDFQWPYHLRVFSTVLLSTAMLAAIVYECWTRNGNEYAEPDDDKVVIVPVYDDDIDELPDYGEPL